MILDILKSWQGSTIFGLILGILLTIFEIGVPAINLLAFGTLAGACIGVAKETFLYFSELGGSSFKNLGLSALGGLIGALIVVLL